VPICQHGAEVFSKEMRAKVKAKIKVDQAARVEALQKSLKHCHVVQPDDEDE
jgi:hydrogenase maturation factor